jgi:hypothetical protein
MTYRSRIHADETYLLALGQAFYNFTYLEWGIVWTIVKLSANGFDSVPRGKPASEIARALSKAIANSQPPLPAKLRRRLIKVDEAYRDAIGARNKLLHAHPFTAGDGSQQLGGGGHVWPIESVNKAAKQFEDAAVMCNDIFHGELAAVRP